MEGQSIQAALGPRANMQRPFKLHPEIKSRNIFFAWQGRSLNAALGHHANMQNPFKLSPKGQPTPVAPVAPAQREALQDGSHGKTLGL